MISGKIIKKNGILVNSGFKNQKKRVFYITMTWAPVAQLDRASASGVEGHEFESRRVYHFFCLFRLRIPVLRRFCFLLPKAAKWCKSNKKSVKSPSKVRQEFPVRKGGSCSMAVFRPWSQIQERDIR